MSPAIRRLAQQLSDDLGSRDRHGGQVPVGADAAHCLTVIFQGGAGERQQVGERVVVRAVQHERPPVLRFRPAAGSRGSDSCTWGCIRISLATLLAESASYAQCA